MKMIKRIKGWKLPIVAGISLFFALATVLGRTDSSRQEPAKMPPVAPFLHTVAGVGIIEPVSEFIAIGTEIPGIVRDVYLQVGQKVQKGAPIFSLDQRDIDAQISVLQAKLHSAEVQAEDFSTQFQLVDGIGDVRAVARDEYNRRKYAAEFGAAHAKEIQAQLRLARTTKERMTVNTPIDGTVLSVNIHAGEFASAGSMNTPFVLMGDLSTLHVRVDFDEEHVARLREDCLAVAYPRGEGKKAYSLQFVRIEPYVSPKRNLVVSDKRVDTRVVQFIYALPSGTEDLFVGQQMDVYVEAKRN